MSVTEKQFVLLILAKRERIRQAMRSFSCKHFPFLLLWIVTQIPEYVLIHNFSWSAPTKIITVNRGKVSKTVCKLEKSTLEYYRISSAIKISFIKDKKNPTLNKIWHVSETLLFNYSLLRTLEKRASGWSRCFLLLWLACSQGCLFWPLSGPGSLWRRSRLWVRSGSGLHSCQRTTPLLPGPDQGQLCLDTDRPGTDPTGQKTQEMRGWEDRCKCWVCGHGKNPTRHTEKQ